MVSQNKPFVFINYSVSNTITATENFSMPCQHLLSFLLFIILIYFAYMCKCVCVIGHVWRAENNLGRLVLYFYHVSARDQTQVIKFGSQQHYPLSYLASPFYDFLILAIIMTNGNKRCKVMSHCGCLFCCTGSKQGLLMYQWKSSVIEMYPQSSHSGSDSLYYQFHRV